MLIPTSDRPDVLKLKTAEAAAGLPVVVVTPGINRAVRPQCQRVKASSGDGRDARKTAATELGINVAASGAYCAIG